MIDKLRFLVVCGTLAAVSACGGESKPEPAIPSVKEGYINVTGGKVWYKIVGMDKAAIPLMTLHGGPGAPHDYLEPLEALADARPVIFYDQLGCGNSDRPEDVSLWTVERFVGELAQVRDAIGIEKMHILGQSWGSMLGVRYVLDRQPEGIVSLVLSGPYLSSPRFIEDQRAWLRQMPEDLQKTILECEAAGTFDSEEYQTAAIEYYERHVCRLIPWPECLNRTLEKMGDAVYEQMWGHSEFTTTGTLKDADLSPQLGEIAVPTLLTCGRYDEATPETTAYYQSLIPGSEMMIFEDASHNHHLEQPEEYMQVVREFLRKAEKGVGI
ncbi:MAG TPA: proline iminopeptidase-family hydrolase [bacterium]|nr:proline iminopeptidase-family hydrolase [bacterium]